MTTIRVIDRSEALQLYLDWFNNFLTVGRFAEYYGLNTTQANAVINLGRETLNNQLYDRNRITVKKG